MRPIIPSAAAAVVASASVARASVTVGSAEDYDALLAKLVGDIMNSTAPEEPTPTAPIVEQKGECTPPAAGPVAHDAVEIEPDVGVLDTCGATEICAADQTSSLGGRCRERPKISIPPPALEESSEESSASECPAACPKEMCDCRESDGMLRGCAKEIHSLCTQSDITLCFDKEEYAPFYEQTYCPMAACLEYGNEYEECKCGYYVNYCTLYWDYVQSNDDVRYSCIIAKCCQMAKTGPEKKACIAVETKLWPKEIWGGGNKTQETGLWRKEKTKAKVLV